MAGFNKIWHIALFLNINLKVYFSETEMFKYEMNIRAPFQTGMEEQFVEPMIVSELGLNQNVRSEGIKKICTI